VEKYYCSNYYVLACAAFRGGLLKAKKCDRLSAPNHLHVPKKHNFYFNCATADTSREGSSQKKKQMRFEVIWRRGAKNIG
jgi:hypothetical protein